MRNHDLGCQGQGRWRFGCGQRSGGGCEEAKAAAKLERGEEDPDRAGEFFYPGVGDGRGPALRDRAQPVIGLAQSSAPGQAGGAVIGCRRNRLGLLPTLRWKSALRW